MSSEHPAQRAVVVRQLREDRHERTRVVAQRALDAAAAPQLLVEQLREEQRDGDDRESDRHEEPRGVEVGEAVEVDEHREVQRRDLDRVDAVVEPLARERPTTPQARELPVGRVERVADRQQRRRDRRPPTADERDRRDARGGEDRADDRDVVRCEVGVIRGRGGGAAEPPVDEDRVRLTALPALLGCRRGGARSRGRSRSGGHRPAAGAVRVSSMVTRRASEGECSRAPAPAEHAAGVARATPGAGTGLRTRRRRRPTGRPRRGRGTVRRGCSVPVAVGFGGFDERADFGGRRPVAARVAEHVAVERHREGVRRGAGTDRRAAATGSCRRRSGRADR